MSLFFVGRYLREIVQKPVEPWEAHEFTNFSALLNLEHMTCTGTSSSLSSRLKFI